MGCGSTYRKLTPKISSGDELPDYKDLKAPHWVMMADSVRSSHPLCEKGCGIRGNPSRDEYLAKQTCTSILLTLNIPAICDMIYAAKEKHGDKIALRVERVKEEKTGKMVTVPIKKVDGRFDASALPDGEWQEWCVACVTTPV
eukprot:1352575-Amorphochlora_amoeboformis.AAC.1